jgi:hypothetical protein
MAALTATAMLVGLLVIAAGFAGPVSFFNGLFAEELTEDPSAPLARAVLAVVSGVGATAVIAVGVTVLVANALFFIRSLARLVTVGRIREPA